MIDWSQLRDMMWEARWDGLVMIAQAAWKTAIAHWWFGVLFLAILLRLCRRAWMRLIRYVGITFIRGSSS